MYRIILLSLSLSAMLIGCTPSGTTIHDQWQAKLDAGHAAVTAGRLDEAERRLQEALVYAERENPPGLRTAVTRNSLGVVHEKRHELDKAESLFTSAIAIFESANGADTEVFAGILCNLGDVYLQTKKCSEAEAVYRRAVGILGNVKCESPDISHSALLGLTASLCALGRHDEARQLGSSIGVTCQ